VKKNIKKEIGIYAGLTEILNIYPADVRKNSAKSPVKIEIVQLRHIFFINLLYQKTIF